jgi:subtilase family serine protease
MTTALACALAFGSIAGASPAAADAPNLDRVPLPGSRPTWARAANRAGGIADDASIVLRVYLHTRDDDGLRAVADAVSDPASTQYREFLSADDVRARYAATDATVASVEQWLHAAGLRVVGVPTNHMFVEVEGTAKRVASAFGVRLGAYRVRGRVLRAADRNLSIPKDLDGVVSAVVGVDESQALMVPKHIADERPPRKPAPPSPGFRNARPCSAFWRELVDTTDPPYGGGFPSPLSYAPCGYTPRQLRSAYGLASVVNGGIDGSGVTVAIIDAFASPTIFEDASEYARRHDPSHPLQP